MTNLKKARLGTGLTQGQAAQQLGVTERTLRSYEQGGPVPSTVLVKLSRLTGKTVDYLVGLTN